MTKYYDTRREETFDFGFLRSHNSSLSTLDSYTLYRARGTDVLDTSEGAWPGLMKKQHKGR